MDVSVIIPSYNTRKETANCVKSCLSEGLGYKIEIIVVDNASDDGSVFYLKKLFNRNKNVVIVNNSGNLGFSKAVNIGLKLSKGKYKYLLNSDTGVGKGVFSKIVNFVEKVENVGVIGTKLILPDGETQRSCFNFPTALNAIKEYWLGREDVYSPFYKKEVFEVDAVVGASFFITPEAFQKVGFFDERYFMYFEDLDYCRRVKGAGLKIIYLPDAEIFHYHGLSGEKLTGRDVQRRRLVTSSKIYHGILKYYLINFVLWSGQKGGKIKNILKNEEH
jgi:GT2 family glycosyltransferase